MFAQALPEFLQAGWILDIIRIVMSVVGGIVGWFVFDPLTRIIYRITARSKTPGWLLPWTKLTGAAAMAALVFFFLPLGGGGGSGGGGWWPGGGGKGGSNKNDGVVKNGEPVKDDKNPKKVAKPRDSVDIEILGGERFKDDGKFRYYLRNRKEPALSLAEVEEYFNQNHAKIQVNIRMTMDSIVINSEEDPTRKLEKLADNYKIPSTRQEFKE